LANNEYIVRDAIDVAPDDAPVLIASHLVNALAAEYFGDPHSVRPNHEARYHDEHGRFYANLRWAIYTPEGAKPITKIEPFQGTPEPRAEPTHFVSDIEDRDLLQPQFVPQGEVFYQQSDYLLITALPRDARFDRRIISLAGAHKPGTLAAEQFLSDSSQALRLLKDIHIKVKGDPYYQALIALGVDNSNPGYPRPTELNLVDAVPLKTVLHK
jgi:hypothetical protein